MNHSILAATLLVTLNVAASRPAHAEDNTPPPGFKALFNGKDLTGWKGLVADPKKRAAMSAEQLAKAQVEADRRMRDHWRVVDGVLVFDGKGDNLCTARDYGNFEFHVDWKIKAKGDSGIYLRGSPQVQIWDPALRDIGSGGLFNNKNNPADPLVTADKPVGAWNSFRIRMVGERVTVHLNDKLVVDNVVLENYWERDKPIYPTGQIELQNHGNTLYFKNICLRELPDAPSATSTARGVVYHDRNGNGRRDDDEEGLPGVRVSNQREIVTTDAAGTWQLPVDDDTTVFVIKPSGWMTPIDPETLLPRFYYTHKPGGSPKAKFAGVAPTGPLPASIDFALTKRHEPAQFKAIFFGDTQSRNEDEVRYMAHDVVEELVGTDAAFGVTLGDIVFDDLSVFDLHNRTVALIGIPWYNVIGNHDINYDAATDKHSDETFERFYGPAYYAFDHGPTHFIVLDNVVWTGTTAEKKGSYTGGLGADQLAFVRNDLAGVPASKLVMLMMHIPLTDTHDRQELYRLIEKRPYALSISAHRHIQEHRFITSEDGWRGPEPHHHIVNVTVCGSWWSGAPDVLGIPHTTMADGAPNGYSIITFDGHEAAYVFKAARRPAGYQMNIYAPEHVRASEADDTEVLVNVFGGSERSTVEMKLGPGDAWMTMRMERREDPAYVRVKASESSETPPPGRPMREPMLSGHIWVGRLPADPPSGLWLIQVRTTDMYGQRYTAQRSILVRGG